MQRKGSSPIPPGRPAKPLSGPSRRGPVQTPGERRTRLLAGASSLAVHLAIFAGLFWLTGAPQALRPVPSMPPLQVRLEDSKPPGPPDPVRPDADAAEDFVQPKRLTPPMPVVALAPTADTSDLLSASQLAGAANADAGDGGGGGGSCNVARLVQQALQRDPLVRTAVENAHRQGMAIMLWDGDWVRSGDQDGKGLSAVREAIVWELAFAPQACRNQRVHGLVLLSLADEGTRFAIGADDWRWSDLLGLRGVSQTR